MLITFCVGNACPLSHVIRNPADLVDTGSKYGAEFAMKDKAKRHNKDYFFIDVDPRSRRIVGWGIEQRDKVDVQLTNGCHRVFLSKGQYGKLVKKLAND